MSDPRDGMSWAPRAEKPRPVVGPGEFGFAAAFVDHGHMYGQTNGLAEAGGQCKWAWDPDPERLRKFCDASPGVRPARSYDEILEDAAVQLVTAAAVPCERPDIGFQCLRAGKDYLTDK